MTGGHQADIALLEQPPLVETGVQVGQPAHGQVHTAARHLVACGRRRVAHGVDGHLGRLGLEHLHQARQEDDLADVGHRHAEGPLTARGFEGPRTGQRLLQRLERRAYRQRQRLRMRRGQHALGAAHEEWVAGGAAQARQRVAHGRRRQLEPRRGRHHLAFAHQRVKHAQQVQVLQIGAGLRPSFMR